MGRPRRHLRRPRPASIAATVAFFLAAGGVGYAVTGSGTFQKENELGLDSPGPEIIRTIAGVGDIRTTCSGGNPTVKVHNASGEQLKLRLDKGNQLFWTDSLDDGEDHDPGFITEDEILQYHVSPTDGSKAPQADITVSVNHTGNCASTEVAVLSVTTTSSGSGTVEGSGTVQKASLEGLPPTQTAIRTVAGTGAVRVECSGGQTNLYFKNTSGETLIVSSDFIDTFEQDLVAHGANEGGIGFGSDNALRYHVFPADGSKRPQADIAVSIDDTDDCATNEVSVLSVTTEQ